MTCSVLFAGVITGTYGGDAGANSGGSVASLSAKRIPGTSTANWKPFKVCRDGRCVGALGSYQGQEVLVFSFPDSRSAAAFYSDPSKLNDYEVAISESPSYRRAVRSLSRRGGCKYDPALRVPRARTLRHHQLEHLLQSRASRIHARRDLPPRRSKSPR